MNPPAVTIIALSFNGRIPGSDPGSLGSNPSGATILEVLWKRKSMSTPTPPHSSTTPGSNTTPTSKVAFARHADTAQRVAEVDTSPPPTLPTQLIPSSQGQAKVAIPHQYNPPGRPKLAAQCNLPPGYRNLRRGLATYNDELADKFIDAYYANAGSFTRACRDCGVRYSSALTWRDTIPHFRQALEEVDEIIKDEVHSQFMERVLTTWESNPTWKLTYFKKHFPQYSEVKKSAKIVFSIKDTLMKPDIIEGEVVPLKQLESSDESRPTEAVDPPANAGKVS